MAAPHNPDFGPTRHSEESLAEALWFLLNAAWPDPFFEDACGSAVGIAIASKEWAKEIGAALSNPTEFSATLLESDEESP